MSQRFDTTKIPNLSGKVAIVTGGNGGIGYQTTKQLANHGARVYMASRNQEKCEKAMKELQEEHDKLPEDQKNGVEKLDIQFVKLDLMQLSSCKEAGEAFCSKEDRLDILVCNAGIMAAGYEITKDGFEQQFQTNHLSHFALFYAVAPLMVQTAKKTGHPSRVVNLSSIAHTFCRYNPLLKIKFDSKESVNRKMGVDQVGKYMRYSQSKLSNLLFARAINRRYKPNEIRATGVHPGFVASDLYKGTPLAPIAPRIFISSADGALSTLYAATSTEIEEKNGWDHYYVTYGFKGDDYHLARDEKLMNDLWSLSEDLTGLKFEQGDNGVANGNHVSAAA
jgi:NAD(P)-dependent dehydrogenase (short-subunit alcohol dehydrogenase family)